MKDRYLNIPISPDLHEKLKAAAERKEISMASLVRLACVEWLDREGVVKTYSDELPGKSFILLDDGTLVEDGE